MNDLTLQNSIDENLRPVKVAGQNSALEISTENARVNGSLEVAGDVTMPVRAGDIIGYTSVGSDSAHTSESLTTSYAVVDADLKVDFIVPPSGCVEVMVQIYQNSLSSNKSLYLALSSDSSYSSVGNSYEQLVSYPDETDDGVIVNHWVVKGLTVNRPTTYWLGAKTSGTTKYLAWGGTASNRYCDFIMKVTALPSNLITLG